MNKQTFEILKKMINGRGKSLKSANILEKYDISSRTFYNYINEINYFLKDHNIKGGVLLEADMLVSDIKKEDYSRLPSYLNSMSFDDYKLSNQERKLIILLILLSSSGSVKGKYLEDILLVSRTSIINDLHYVKEYLSKNNISFKENTHNGLELECEEKIRRELIIDLLVEHITNNSDCIFLPIDPCTSFILTFLKMDKTRFVCEKAVKECEEKTGIELSDQDFYTLTVIISYIISRIKTKNQLSRQYYDFVENDLAFNFSEQVFSRLKDITKYSYAEIEFLSQIIRKYHFDSFADKKGYMDKSYLRLIVKDLLDSLSFYFKANLCEDTTLLNFLVAHIDSCQHRISNGEKLNNPFLSEIKKKYMDYFVLLKNHIYILENGLSISLNNDEIALILMHILASVERSKEMDYIPNVVVACGSGAATSNFLAALVKKSFKVNIISVSSVHNTISVVENNNVDLIISTIPFSVNDIPVVVVDPYLRKEDLESIRHAISKTSNAAIHIEPKELPAIEELINKYSEKDIDFDQIVSRDLIKLNCEAGSWQEAIIAAGELLLWEKCITVNYLQQMISLVTKYGPYIVIAKGVAFAHAAPAQGSLKNGLSIVRLKEPVEFGKEEFDPVKIVVGCSLLESPKNMNALLSIMKMIKNPKFYETIDNATNADNVLALFKRMDNSDGKDKSDYI